MSVRIVELARHDTRSLTRAVRNNIALLKECRGSYVRHCYKHGTPDGVLVLVAVAGYKHVTPNGVTEPEETIIAILEEITCVN